MSMSINPYQTPREGLSAARPSPLPVRATGVLTVDDAIAALRTEGKWNAWRNVLIFVGVFSIITGLLMLQRPRQLGVMAVYLGIGSLIVVLAALRARSRFAKSWNARFENQQPISWTISEEGLLIETANSKHLHSWGAFIKAKVTPDKIIITQQGGAMFNFIPRRFFETDGDWLAVRQLLASKLPLRETGR